MLTIHMSEQTFGNKSSVLCGNTIVLIEIMFCDGQRRALVKTTLVSHSQNLTGGWNSFQGNIAALSQRATAKYPLFNGSWSIKRRPLPAAIMATGQKAICVVLVSPVSNFEARLKVLMIYSIWTLSIDLSNTGAIGTFGLHHWPVVISWKSP